MFNTIKKRYNQKVQSFFERRIKPTKSQRLSQKVVYIFPSHKGLVYVITVITLFVGGVNYANSLMLAVCFMLASLFIITILHTFRNLSGLEISVGRNQNAFAGDKALFVVRIKKLFERPYEAIHLRWGEVDSGAIDLIDDSQVDVEMMLPCDRRGEFRPGMLRLETFFPLGVIRSWSWVKLDTSCLVYPRPIENQYPLQGANRKGETGKKTIPNGVDDFNNLRNYRQGDSLKHLDWKAYAKTDELYTKSFVDCAQEEISLDWEAFGQLDTELKLSYMCYWVLRLSENDRVFSLHLPGVDIKPSSGDQHKQVCLSALARY